MKGLGQIVAMSALALALGGTAWAAGVTLSKGQVIRQEAGTASTACCGSGWRAERNPKGGVTAQKGTICHRQTMQVACTCPEEATAGGCCMH